MSRRFLVGSFTVALAALAGCDDGPQPAACPAGRTLASDGRCVIDRDGATDSGGGRPERDTGVPPDTTTGEDVEGPVSCEPGARSCAGEASARVCNADGTSYRLEVCLGGSTCVDGACVGGDTTCTPGRTRCDGETLLRCNDAREEEFVQECQFGCSAGACADPCAGDGKNYLGCTFYAVDLDNIGDNGGISGADNAQFAVTVSNGTATDAEVTITGGSLGGALSRTVRAGALETFNLPPANIDGSGLFDLAYRIETSSPVTVHQFNPLNNDGVFSNDASLLLPATSVGSEYVAIGWGSSGAALQAFVTVVASSPGLTRVTVTSPVATAGGSGTPPLTPGVATNFDLAQGQVLAFATPEGTAADLSGMRIVASQPVAVFSGHECANVPQGVPYCDHLEQQLLPVEAWGREFVGAKFQPRGREPDVWKIVATRDGTTLQTDPLIPGVGGRTIGTGEVVQFETTEDFILFASQPVSLAQFMVGSSYPGAEGGCDPSALTPREFGCAIPRDCGGSGVGDPAFVLAVPSAQFRSDYLVLTPAQYRDNFLTMTAPPGTTIFVDDVEVTAPRTRVSTWDIIRVPSAAGIHRIVATAPIGLSAYGYDCDVSYAYPGGLNLDAL